MPATIKDIREVTGLSLATISKYLNGGNVLPENRRKIEAAIKELHYEVNEMARGLVTNRTRTVGVIIYSIESLFNGTLLHYIGNKLRSSGYGMLICDSCNDEEVEKENIRFLLGKKVDGIIIIPVARNAGIYSSIKKAGVPLVQLDRAIPNAGYDCVRIDNRQTAAWAVEKLIEKKHRDIAIICSASEYTGVERYKGYMDALERIGVKPLEEYQKKGIHSIEFGYGSMKELLHLKKRPTAVFMTNYEITLGAVMAVNESEYQCPEDISMLGFDDLILSHLVKPKMCMVVQPMKEMSEKAVELLLARIGNPEEHVPMEVVLGTSYSVGNSIAKLG